MAAGKCQRAKTERRSAPDQRFTVSAFGTRNNRTSNSIPRSIAGSVAAIAALAAGVTAVEVAAPAGPAAAAQSAASTAAQSAAAQSAAGPAAAAPSATTVSSSFAAGLAGRSPAVTPAVVVASRPASGVVATSAGSGRHVYARRLSRKIMRRHYPWNVWHQYRYLSRLWQRESSWNHYAYNPYSGAYGIPQAVPGSKMSSAGPRWRQSCRTQITWGLRYIHGRYRTPRGAWRHETRYGWY
jgi:hypothetical protein